MSDLPLFITTAEEENFELKKQLSAAQNQIELLTQKDAEHKAEIEKLKAHVNNLNYAMESIIDEGNFFDFEDMNNILEMSPQQSLSEHDKQVKVEVLETLVEQSTFRGLRNSIQPEELDELINQIKEEK